MEGSMGHDAFKKDVIWIYKICTNLWFGRVGLNPKDQRGLNTTKVYMLTMCMVKRMDKV